MISHKEKLYAYEADNMMMMIQLSNKPLKNRLPVTVFLHLFILRVVNFSSKQVTKDNIVWGTKSRKLVLQHHSFKNSMTLYPAWTRKVKSKLLKLLSLQYEDLQHVNIL